MHRDIKPENILLQDGQRAGGGLRHRPGGQRPPAATQLTETGLTLGTPAYMSPEQAAGEDQLDGRSDLYALGCVLYEMLAGEPPFTGRTAQAILARHAIDPVPSLRTVRSTVPLALDHAISTALAKVPADRFATAGAFVSALDQAASVTAPSRPGLRIRKTLLLGLIVAIVAVGIGYLIRRSPSTAASSPKLVAILPFRTSGASP